MDPICELQRLQGNLIRFGTVAEVDLENARCRVDTGEIRSDFVPWFAPRAGDTIEWSAPSVGEQGLLLSGGGDTHGAVFLRGLYSDAFPAPANAQSSHLVQHADGAVIEYDDDAHVLKATLPRGGTAQITADGGVTIHGPLTVFGDTQINGDIGVSGTAEAKVDVIGGGIRLKMHKHIGVMSGSAISGPPQ